MGPIYTKTGDAGLTSLFGGGRVGKDHPLVEAYGEVDELNAALGMARAFGPAKDLDELLQSLQEQLFTIGAILATPRESKAAAHIPKLRPEWAAEMERMIDRFDQELEPLKVFILPGGSRTSAALHFARTVCRRAERRVVTLHREGQVDVAVVIYLNRLSDYLFTLARVANLREQVRDVAWTSG